jgi:hypothetical protein
MHKMLGFVQKNTFCSIRGSNQRPLFMLSFCGTLYDVFVDALCFITVSLYMLYSFLLEML